MDFNKTSYNAIRQDRYGGQGRGCATFIKEAISYGIVFINCNTDSELVVTVIMIQYNPCTRIKIEELERLEQGSKEMLTIHYGREGNGLQWADCRGTNGVK